MKGHFGSVDVLLQWDNIYQEVAILRYCHMIQYRSHFELVLVEELETLFFLHRRKHRTKGRLVSCPDPIPELVPSPDPILELVPSQIPFQS